jgi:hypothetical protein
VNLSHAKRTDSDILKDSLIYIFIFIMRMKYIVIQLSSLSERTLDHKL